MAANATQHRSVRALCEGAIMVALAQILAYLKLYELPQGGSITLAMVPIFFFAVRWGWKKGLGCAFVFGLLQLLLDGGFAIGWQSMLAIISSPSASWVWPVSSPESPTASSPALLSALWPASWSIGWWAPPFGLNICPTSSLA